MLRSPLHTFDHRVFGSMIDRDDPQVIPNYFAGNIQNWIIRNRGELQMRDGLTARGTQPLATNLGSAVAYRADGSVYFYRVLDGAANSAKFQVSTNGSTWTDIASGGSRTTGRVWHFAQANNFMYAVNGYDTPVKLNANIITTIAAIPNGTTIHWWNNFLWVGGVISIPDRLYISNAADPETFGGSDFINVNLGDASQLVGIRGLGGGVPRLFIGKERSVWYITGTSLSNFTLNLLTYEHGVASEESMIQVKNDIWCIDLEGNIRGLYRTGEDQPFSNIRSKDIDNTIAGLNKISLHKSSAVYFDKFALFFVPNGVDDYNSLVLVWDTQANEGKGGWSTFTNWNIARATIFDTNQPKLFLHDARTSNGQTYEWAGTSDNGVAILARYDTKIYDHTFPDQLKKWAFHYQYAPVVGNVNMNFYVSIDRYYFTKVREINLSGDSSVWGSMIWGEDDWGTGGVVRAKVRHADNYPFIGGGAQTNGYTMQVRLEAVSTTTKIKVRRFTSHFRIKGLR